MSDPGTGNQRNAYVPDFQHDGRGQTQVSTGDPTQSNPTADGDYGSTGYPGNTTTADNIGASGGVSDHELRGRSNVDASRLDGPQVSSGDFSQSTQDSRGGYGSTAYPGDMSDAGQMGIADGRSSTGTGGGSLADRAMGKYQTLLCTDYVDSERLAGAFEQVAGKVTGNTGTQQRGERRVGDKPT